MTSGIQRYGRMPMTEEQAIALRDKLLGLRCRTLSLLAERSEDTLTDAGLLALIADAQTALKALDEEEGRTS